MGHIDYKRKTKGQATPSEWLPVGSKIGMLANMWASRGDLIAYVGPGAGGTAPACFTPATAEVEVNVETAFGKGIKPEMIGDLTQRDVMYEWPKAIGAIYHEAMHARFSTWDIIAMQHELTRHEFMALVYLEEGRIEKRGVALDPDMAAFLKACALELVVADMRDNPIEGSKTRIAASMAALTYARIDAGVLDFDDLADLGTMIVGILGVELYDKLRALWQQAQDTEAANITALMDIARRWEALVKEVSEERGEEDAEDGQPGDGSGSGDGSGDGEGSSSGLGAEDFAEMMEALEEAAEATAVSVNDQLADQQERQDWKDEAKSRAGAAKQAKDARDTAADVFGKGTGPVADTHTHSSLVEERQPTGPERAAAVKVAQMLDKAKYRDRDEKEIHSILPPGRLRTRAMVQGAALKSKGVMTQVEPWRRTVRKHVDDPTLSVGMMVDISGSMSDAMQPMAVSAWVMSEAVRRVQGRAAMVYYGQGVFPTLKPGQHLDKVRVYSAPDGTERFDKAFKALDGGVSLLSGGGARLLVVASDGCYTHAEGQAARKWINECDRAGVGVLWLTFEHHGHVSREAEHICRGTKAQVVACGRDIASAAQLIGAAAAKALTAVGGAGK